MRAVHQHSTERSHQRAMSCKWVAVNVGFQKKKNKKIIIFLPTNRRISKQTYREILNEKSNKWRFFLPSHILVLVSWLSCITAHNSHTVACHFYVYRCAREHSSSAIIILLSLLFSCLVCIFLIKNHFELWAVMLNNAELRHWASRNTAVNLCDLLLCDSISI